MASIANFWNQILDWFQDRHDRTQLIRSFNQVAREAYVSGAAPFSLEASVSRGYGPYKHQYSNFFNSGFRINVYSWRYLCSKQDLINVGNVIMSNDMLVRRLVILGFDTLEVCSDSGNQGCRWQLSDYIMINQSNE